MSDPTEQAGRHSLGTSPPEEENTSEPQVGELDTAELDTAERRDSWHDNERPQDSDVTEELEPLAHTEQPEAGEPPQEAVTDATEWVRQVDEPAARVTRLTGRLGSGTGIWIGITVVAVGFVGIFVGWRQVAGLTNVAEQMPFLVSGGLVGLALVIVGATILDVAVRRQDSRERREQLVQMNRTLSELRELFEAEEPIEAEEYVPEHHEVTV